MQAPAPVLAAAVPTRAARRLRLLWAARAAPRCTAAEDSTMRNSSIVACSGMALYRTPDGMLQLSRCLH